MIDLLKTLPRGLIAVSICLCAHSERTTHSFPSRFYTLAPDSSRHSLHLSHHARTPPMCTRRRRLPVITAPRVASLSPLGFLLTSSRPYMSCAHLPLSSPSSRPCPPHPVAPASVSPFPLAGRLVPALLPSSPLLGARGRRWNPLVRSVVAGSSVGRNDRSLEHSFALCDERETAKEKRQSTSKGWVVWRTGHI